ncbi:MAG TPA: hypothetical protein VEZ14_00515 [Dehalococcoidia bacterium]|nr:hypothetical protein [Dehalococcoidia bacterium]
MAGRRVIGRILSLGVPLPGVRVDNYSFLSAPSFFDYDAVVVDPASLGRLVEDVCAGSANPETLAGAPVRNGATLAGEADLGELLARRRDETAALLAAGGVVICFAHPPVTHDCVVGLTPFDDWYWLPDEVAAACRPPALRPADGTQAHVVDYQHPLASFVSGQLANIAYRARFDETQMQDGHVFVRSRGGAALGVELPVVAGRVIVLPALAALSGDDRYATSEALQAGIRRALGVEAEGREPPWVASYTMPGLDERAGALAAASEAAAAAQDALAAARARYDELARYRRLLWQEGSAGLDEVVLDALRLIGFDVYDHDPAALELRADGNSLLLEVESGDYPIDLAPHYRLRQRIERTLEQRSEAPRGLLIVNGTRTVAPGERAREVTDALRLASETMRYCVAPASTLFAAAVAQLSGDEAAVAAYRCQLVSHDGVIAGAGI